MAAYSLYDVLRTLVERVGWPTEVEKRVCLESINEAEQMGIFGNLAKMMACKHDGEFDTVQFVGNDRRNPVRSNVCRECGRIL